MHDHGHHHHHHHPEDIKRLSIAIALTSLILVLQVVGGFISGSLALLSDAGHVFVDLASLLIAFFGLKLAARARDQHDIRFTFGLRRIEILAALTNGFLLVGICIYIGIEAVKRFMNPTEVHAETMLWIAIVGFVANGIGALLLHRSEHITTRSAYLHVLTDLMSSGGVILGAIILKYTHWEWVDPAISIAIASLILVGAIRVIRESGIILMESAPVHIDPEEVKLKIYGIHGIDNVHDVHVWQLGQEEFNASVHVVSDLHSDDVVQKVQRTLHEDFGIDHTTVQVESTQMEGECGAC